jgi:hypothetical protein
MQCDAITLASTYSAPHRCLKTKGLVTVKKRRLCPHHRSAPADAQPVPRRR